jgi:hypothetical protein
MNAYLSTFNYTRIGPLSPYLYGIQHLKFACQSGSLGGRAVHLIVGLSELIPGLNNIIAFAEHYFTYRHCLKTLGAPHQNELRRCGIESMADLQALGLFITDKNELASRLERGPLFDQLYVQDNLPADFAKTYLKTYLEQAFIRPAWLSLRRQQRRHQSLATYPADQMFKIGVEYGNSIPYIRT